MPIILENLLFFILSPNCKFQGKSKIFVRASIRFEWRISVDVRWVKELLPLHPTDFSLILLYETVKIWCLVCLSIVTFFMPL